MTCRARILVLALLVASSSVDAFFASPHLRRTTRCQLAPVETKGDVESTATMLSESVREWLDEEWIEQDCHQRIGKRVADAYRSARQDGITEIGDLLVRVGTELGGNGPTAASTVDDFFDAFVGPWDVANYVSDILVQQETGEKSCCS